MKQTLAIFLSSLSLSSCGVYSFTGTNVDADSINIGYIENQARLASPYLSPEITQRLKDRVQNLTKLQILDIDSTDLSLTGVVTTYKVEVTSLQNVDQATQNRLKIGVEMTYKNNKEPKDDFTKNFERFADFSADVTLQEVETQLIDEIVELLVNDIFNAAFANW